MRETIEVRRIQAGEERLAQNALQALIPEDERDGKMASLRHLQHFLEERTNCLILAVRGTEPIGFAIAYTMPAYYRDGWMAYLYDICVRPEHRRNGIASRMIEELKACLRSEGVDSFWVGTDCSNAPAMLLYEATGGVRESSSFVEFWYENL
jgi:aminoglycoside 3-N-acetyltransferase I